MKRTWTIIGVSDVPSSFKWYQSLFGHRDTTRPSLFWSAPRLGWNGPALPPRHSPCSCYTALPGALKLAINRHLGGTSYLSIPATIAVSFAQ
jgi:hypothetical protein